MIPPTSAPTKDYGWIIDVDHLASDPADDSDAGVTGPSTAPQHYLTALKQTFQGTRFRLLDDDGNLYYSGRVIGGGPDADEDAAFGPLWDFGTPNAGCTEIEYQDASGTWVQL